MPNQQVLSATITASMLKDHGPRFSSLLLAFVLLSSAGCRRKALEPADRPRLTPKVIFRDVPFRSAALHRDMPDRVILPAALAAGEKLQVVYLLHGGGGGFRDWTNDSDVARLA